MTVEDDRIAAAVRAELAEGQRALSDHVTRTASLTVHPADAFGTTLIELRGRFATRPDREVAVLVAVDPARVGWRLEAGLYEQADSEAAERLVCDLGSHRVREQADAIAAARELGREAVRALQAHLAARIP